MNFDDRTRQILAKVRALDAQFGRAVGSTAGAKLARLITDQPAIWKARIIPDYRTQGSAGDNGAEPLAWDLFQLWAYDDLRVTAHVRGDQVAVTLYLPGPWEPIFSLPERPGAAALLPAGYMGTVTLERGAFY